MSSDLYIASEFARQKCALRGRIAYFFKAVGMLLFRQNFVAKLACVAAVLLGGISANCAWAQVGMSEPDDTKPVQVTGCMTARTKTGGFILSGVFGRPVTVIGPNYLQLGLGHQVTLTGTWETNGIAPKGENVDAPKMFVATAVKVTAKQCSAPPSSTASARITDNKKSQR